MTDKEQIKSIIKQYADKGERLFLEASESNESYVESYWDGYKDCANGLLRELEDIQEEPEYLEEETTYCAFSTSRYTDKDRKALCEGCDEECKFNQKKMLISENLLQASIAYADAHSEYCADKNGRVVEHYNIRAKEHFIAGANWQKEQMMAKAVDTEVKIDAGGYPYVDATIELYDYVEDIPLAKRGDKVKILVIRES